VTRFVPPPKNPWLDEEDEVLRREWRNMSGTQIGRLIGRTKNAVIGRAHRLGLRKLAPQVKLLPVEHPAAEPAEPAKPAEPARQARGRRWMPLLELRSRDCRWPDQVRDLSAKATRFCGAPAIPGSSYCGQHHRHSKRIDR